MPSDCTSFNSLQKTNTAVEPNPARIPVEARWAENHEQHVDFVRVKEINLLRHPRVPYDGEGESTDPCYCLKNTPYDSS